MALDCTYLSILVKKWFVSSWWGPTWNKKYDIIYDTPLFISQTIQTEVDIKCLQPSFPKFSEMWDFWILVLIIDHMITILSL